uniref:Uncharacterized protein n=1 Tax=Anguilla anguilla TaxID=7936 RepID=A0A0E9WYI0_ANGAN
MSLFRVHYIKPVKDIQTQVIHLTSNKQDFNHYFPMSYTQRPIKAKSRIMHVLHYKLLIDSVFS